MTDEQKKTTKTNMHTRAQHKQYDDDDDDNLCREVETRKKKKNKTI